MHSTFAVFHFLLIAHCLMSQQWTSVAFADDDEDSIIATAQCKAACLDLFIRRWNPSINFIRSQLSSQTQDLLSLELSQCHSNISTTFQSSVSSQSESQGSLLTASSSSNKRRRRSGESGAYVEADQQKRSQISCVTMCGKGCEIQSGTCVRDCKGSTSCLIGCELREGFGSSRSGDCPQPSPESLVKNKGPQKECSSTCRSDSGCMLLQKCCTMGCSRTCVEPHYNDSVPETLNKLDLHIAPDGNVETDWRQPYKKFLQTEGSLTFVLQARFCECKFYQPQLQSKWKTLTMTPQLGAKLDQFDPGRIYQFRLLAVSTHGSRGFSPPSHPFPERPVAPSSPSPPTNLTDGIWRMYADGRTSVVITWDEPTNHHLKISEYEITWSLDHGVVQSDGRSMESFTKYRQIIPSNRRNYVIENLMMGTSYKVQVQAVSYWAGYGAMKSQPNTLFLTTPKLNNANDELNQLGYKGKGSHNPLSSENNGKDGFSDSSLSSAGTNPSTDECECTTRSPSKGSLINTPGSSWRLSKPFFASGQLTVVLTLPQKEWWIGHKIEWFPRVCIDSQNDRQRDSLQRKRGVMKLENMKSDEFKMSPLQFNCRYEVMVTPLKTGMKSDVITSSTRICFCTPSCGDVSVQPGHTPPICTSQVDQTPPSPGVLSSELVNAQSLTYRLYWNHPFPHGTVGPTSEFKYRIMWAPREEEPVDKEMYNDATGFQPILDLRYSNVRVVSQNVSEIYIQRLRPASLYIAKIQTLRLLTEQQTESQPVLHYFTTPGFQRYGSSNTSAEALRRQDINMKSASAPSVFWCGFCPLLYPLFYFVTIHYLSHMTWTLHGMNLLITNYR